jgi:zinc/manganese transport system substrate-binding protein
MDPHAWQDARLAMGYVRNIEAGLRAAGLAAEAAPLLARLEALDGWIRAQVETVPQARRIVVTSHDAFGYFGAAYGVRFLAPQGIAAGAEPSAQGVAALIRQIRAERVTAVFVEGSAIRRRCAAWPMRPACGSRAACMPMRCPSRMARPALMRRCCATTPR